MAQCDWREKRQLIMSQSRRVVIKVGSAVLAGKNGIDAAVIAGLAEQISKLTLSGHQVLLVSSGAVAAGREVLGAGTLEVQSAAEAERSPLAARLFDVSGVSGVVPKFLSPNTLADYGKGTLATDRYIIKGTTARLPGVALNEHLCMEVSRQAGIPTAHTEVSDDGQALVVHRFDLEDDGATRKGMEDLCSLLLLRPEEKYQSTWERVTGRIKDVVPVAAQQNAALSQLADLLLLTYALRNADCHTKNIALLYTARDNITLAPVYDMLTTTVYDDYAKNPPSMPVDGRSSWMPGKALERFVQTRCGVMPAQTKERVERICEAIVRVTPQVVEAAGRYPAFHETGKRMLHAWNAGMNSLRLQKTWSLPSLEGAIEAARFSDVKPGTPTPVEKVGRSPLLGTR